MKYGLGGRATYLDAGHAIGAVPRRRGAGCLCGGPPVDAELAAASAVRGARRGDRARPPRRLCRTRSYVTCGLSRARSRRGRGLAPRTRSRPCNEAPRRGEHIVTRNLGRWRAQKRQCGSRGGAERVAVARNTATRVAFFEILHDLDEARRFEGVPAMTASRSVTASTISRLGPPRQPGRAPRARCQAAARLLGRLVSAGDNRRRRRPRRTPVDRGRRGVRYRVSSGHGRSIRAAGACRVRLFWQAGGRPAAFPPTARGLGVSAGASSTTRPCICGTLRPAASLLAPSGRRCRTRACSPRTRSSGSGGRACLLLSLLSDPYVGSGESVSFLKSSE